MPQMALLLLDDVALGEGLLSGNDGGVNLFLSQVGCFLVSNKSCLDIM